MPQVAPLGPFPGSASLPTMLGQMAISSTYEPPRLSVQPPPPIFVRPSASPPPLLPLPRPPPQAHTDLATQQYTNASLPDDVAVALGMPPPSSDEELARRLQEEEDAELKQKREEVAAKGRVLGSMNELAPALVSLDSALTKDALEYLQEQHGAGRQEAGILELPQVASCMT